MGYGELNLHTPFIFKRTNMFEVSPMTFKFEPAKEITKEDVRVFVEDILKELFISGSKTKIDDYDDRWNFACPFCGDSDTDHKKKRGNMYFSDFHFHCFNCGEHSSLSWFMKKFERDVKSGQILSFVEKSKNLSGDSGFRSRSEEKVSVIFGEEIIEYAIPIEVFFEKLNLINIEKTKRGMAYLLQREQKDFSNFAWDEKRNLLYVLNLTPDKKKVLGYQIRRFTGNGPKYLTYEMSAMYKELGIGLDEEVSKKLDPLSTIFGCLSVDLSQTITVFEGPLDSFLMPNSIALCSLNKKPPFITTMMRFMFDYDKSGIQKSIELLKEGLSVFMWSKFFLETKGFDGFMDKEKVDFSDIITFSKKHNLIIDYNKYFTNNYLNALCIGKTQKKK
jgi:hypothetical protein